MRSEGAFRTREEEAKELADENRIVAEIGRIVSSTQEIEEVYERFTEQVGKLIPFEGISINTIDQERDIVAFPYVSGIVNIGRPQGDTWRLTGSLAGEVLRTRSGIIIEVDGSAELRSRFPGLSRGYEAGLRSLMAVPLISKDDVIGAIIFRSTRSMVFSDRHLRIAQNIAAQIAGAVANVQLLAQYRRVAEALRESESRLRTILEHVQTGILIIDPETHKIVDANPIAVKLTRVPREKIVGSVCHQFVCPAESGQCPITDLGQTVDNSERILLTADGGTCPVIKSVIPITLGGRIHLLESFVDITGRKRTEDALRESEKRYRALAESAQDLIFIVDDSGCVQYVNPAGATRLGFRNYAIQGKNIKELFSPDEAARLRHNVNKVVQHGRPLKIEDTIRFSEGETWLETQLVPIENESEGHEVRAVLGVSRDVTERRRSEEVLRKSEAMYQKLFHEAPVGYHELDTDGRITQVNETELKMLGYAANEMIGRFAWDFLVEKEAVQQTIHAKFSGSVKPGQIFERTSIRKDGSTFPVAIEGAFIRDAAGNVIGIHTTVQDITERKRAESERRSLEEQLQQSQRLEAIGQLAGGIAHDFNNILGVILGYSDLIEGQLQPAHPLHAQALEIKNAAKRAAALTRQLLAFSRKQILQTEIVDLNTLIVNMDKMLRRVIGEDIFLNIHLAKDLGAIRADPGQIEQVIMNIIVNARDAMPSGGELTMETAPIDLDEHHASEYIGLRAGSYSLITITDTGIGMTREVQSRIFEPFFTTQEKDRGTGLGLPTAYGIVKQSGGNISVYSEPGKGSTFKIYLPKVEGASQENEPSSTATEQPLSGSEIILLVEDEEILRKFVRLSLLKKGYTVLQAAHGEEALRIVEQHRDTRIQLLLTDVVMPGMSGHELAAFLESSRPEMKVLYMSGHTEDAVFRRGVMEKAMNFIPKPFTGDQLSEKVRQILDS